MPRVAISGLETNYQLIGKKPETLLLLHGWGNDWQAWSPLIPELSKQYRLLIPDLPGFGASDSPKRGWETKDYVAWLEQFLQELGIQELSAVIGHSYGGKIATFAWKSENALPQLKQGALLISPSGIPARLSWKRQLLSSILPLFPSFIRRGLFSSWRTFFYTRLLHEEDYLQASPFQEQTLNRILLEDVRKIDQKTNTPFFFCWGENDQAVPLWMAYEYARSTRHSEVFVVPQAGHFPHHSHTELTVRWIKTLLTSHL